ncbi:MAG: UDP-N-acetylmuramate dehydrogenase [Alistipes sp.]|nr:UDP-N-acetylmuramate dehydrogenase [Alistipes sp.]
MKRVYNDINLASRNSFGVVQHASTLVEFDSAEELRDIFAELNPAQWYVLGEGNNTLFTRDYAGLLITPVARGREILSEDDTVVRVRVAAGENWDEFVAWCVERELWGVENLSAIPSSVGAAPVQNIGAYGAEVKDVICVVEYFDVATSEVVRLSNADCEFSYRESCFKHALRGRAIILAVEFELSKIARPNLGYGDVIAEVEKRGGATLRNIREAICDIRSSKLPDPKVLGNAGSFFKNPVVEREVADALSQRYGDMPRYDVPADSSKVKLAAGWLIDRSGLKGYRDGSVGVHERQALVLVNHGGATGGDVLRLADMVCRTVKEKFGVDISPEVNIL